MKPYPNQSGDSGVVAYEIEGDSIKIAFHGGHTYLYDEVKPGLEEVREMQRLAKQGWGLSTYISQEIRERFARKLS